jgi:hypothetical protein
VDSENILQEVKLKKEIYKKCCPFSNFFLQNQAKIRPLFFGPLRNFFVPLATPIAHNSTDCADLKWSHDLES